MLLHSDRAGAFRCLDIDSKPISEALIFISTIEYNFQLHKQVQVHADWVDKSAAFCD